MQATATRFGIYLCGEKGREKLGEVVGPDMMRALRQAARLIVSPSFDLDLSEHQPRFRVTSVYLDGIIPMGEIVWETPWYTVVDVIDIAHEQTMLYRKEDIRFSNMGLAA